jgi:hypothetical protein
MADRLLPEWPYRSKTRMKIPTTDRRVHERFDVLGSLWGVLELPETATVLNVSTTGMLIEAAVCPTLNSVHAVLMLVDGDAVRVDTVVRHCRPGAGGRTCIGLEFLTPPTPVLTSIEQIGADKQIEILDSEVTKS